MPHSISSPWWKSYFYGRKILSPLSRSGVYRLRWSNCPSVYINETGRQLWARILDHLDEANSNDTHIKLKFTEHLTPTRPYYQHQSRQPSPLPDFVKEANHHISIVNLNFPTKWSWYFQQWYEPSKYRLCCNILNFHTFVCSVLLIMCRNLASRVPHLTFSNATPCPEKLSKFSLWPMDHL